MSSNQRIGPAPAHYRCWSRGVFAGVGAGWFAGIGAGVFACVGAGWLYRRRSRVACLCLSRMDLPSSEPVGLPVLEQDGLTVVGAGGFACVGAG